MYFLKWGVVCGKEEIGQLFSDFMMILVGVLYEMFCLNFIQYGDFVCVEGLLSGRLKNGVIWQVGVMYVGCWCDVFEICDFRIQWCYVYLDFDYVGSDMDCYLWFEMNLICCY